MKIEAVETVVEVDGQSSIVAVNITEQVITIAEAVSGPQGAPGIVDYSQVVPYVGAVSDVNIGDHSYLTGSLISVPPLISASAGIITSGEGEE